MVMSKYRMSNLEENLLVPYFITFGLSSMCCACGERCLRHKKKIDAQILFFLAVLLVAGLAGVRDLNIGTDIWTYGEWSFRAARISPNLISFVVSQSDLELLYNILVWIVARFTSNSHWLYFFTSLITCHFIMQGIRQYENQISTTIAWLTFLFLYYGDTLNAMRQFISVSIAFWGLKFAFNKCYKKYLITTIVATLFHNTAILSLLVLFVILFLDKKDNIQRRVIVVAGVSLAAVMYSQILEVFINTGILTDKYERYYSSEFALSLNPIILRLPFLAVIALWYRAYRKGETKTIKRWDRNSEADIITILLIVDLLLSAMRGTLSTLYRAAFIFGMYRTVAYSRICSVLKKNNKLVVTTLLIVYLIVIYFYQNVIQGNNEIFPYTSEILGIK